MVSQSTTGRPDGSTGMRFVVLRLMRHDELGMFHSYRRIKKQRAVDSDAKVVDRVLPAARDIDEVIDAVRTGFAEPASTQELN